MASTSPRWTLAPREIGETSDGPCGAARTWYTSASAKILRTWLIPPACATATRMKSISCSVIRCWQSQIVLNTSPIASGVVVCCRTSRSASWFSAGVTSSSQNRSDVFERLAEPRGLLRGEPVMRVVQQLELRADVLTHLFEHAGHVAQVGVRVPDLLDRRGAAARPARIRRHRGARRTRTPGLVRRICARTARNPSSRRGVDRVEQLRAASQPVAWV